MMRKLPLLVAIIAALLALEPLLHRHPLNTSHDATAAASAGCVICAAGVNPLPHAAPVVDAPQLVVYALVATIIVSLTRGVAVTLPSRAPPLA